MGLVLNKKYHEKYLVTFEFRHYSNLKGGNNRIVTIGHLDTIEEAMKEGNLALEKFSKFFKPKEKRWFSLNGGCFGLPNTLVANSEFEKVPFQLFAKIITLDYSDLESTIQDVIDKIREKNK
jgi:hypothetical protein